MNDLAVPEKLPPEIEKKLRDAVPRWVANIEDTGTAMYQAGQEFLQLVEDLLQRHHGFSEKDIIQLETELKETLPVLQHMELKGLSILTPRDMKVVGDIAEIRKQRLESDRTGVILPSGEEIKKLR